MTTNNVMLRPMGQFQVEQRTKDGMFNATALLKQWNLNTQNFGELKKKDMDDFFANKNVIEFIDALVDEEKLESKQKAYLSSRGKCGGTWMHPILFIKFAMWLNPRFEVQVIKFVYDQMIKFRNDAGDAYKQLSSSVSTIVNKSFMPVAMSQISKAINYVVFGDHYSMIRNDKGEEGMQYELFDMERKVTDLINDGFLKNQDAVMAYLRKKWREKYTPAILKA